MTKQIKHSEATAGEQVTTYGQGATGIGYLVDGVVYKTTGSYYAVDATTMFPRMERYERDGGKGYIAKIRSFGIAV